MCYAQPPVYHGGGPAEAVETPEAAAVDVTVSPCQRSHVRYLAGQVDS